MSNLPDLLTAFSLARIQEELVRMGKRVFRYPSAGMGEASHFKGVDTNLDRILVRA